MEQYKTFQSVMFPGMTGAEYLDLDHYEKYNRIVEKLGRKAVEDCVPFDVDTLKAAYKKDSAFNTINISKWDQAAGYVCRRGEVYRAGSQRLGDIFRKAGVTCYSLSEAVCILKCAARGMIGVA